MEIHRYASDLMDSNMYIIEENGHVIVIDPYRDTTKAGQMTVDWIILTHEHYDHISGVNAWKEKSHAPVLCSAKCAENIQSPRMNLASHFKEFCELQAWKQMDTELEYDNNYVCSADKTFEDEAIFDWKGHQLKLFTIPGHSQGSIGILIDDIYFFSGDSLLQGMKVEFRMPGGSRKDWEKIGKQRLDSVPDGIKVLPGHNIEFIKGQEV